MLYMEIVPEPCLVLKRPLERERGGGGGGGHKKREGEGHGKADG